MRGKELEEDFKELAIQRVSREISQKVSIEFRMRAAYTPIILQNTCCIILEEAMKLFASIKLQPTKHFCRAIRVITDDFQKNSLKAMKSDVYNTIIKKSKWFSDQVGGDLFIHENGFDNILINTMERQPAEISAVAKIYVVREILLFIQEYDDKMDKEYRKKIGAKASALFQGFYSPHVGPLLECINALFDMYGLNYWINSKDTDMSMVIMRNKIKSMIEDRIIEELMNMG